MAGELPSELAGPAFLALVLAAAIPVAARLGPPQRPQRVLAAGCLALAAQAIHVAEEFTTGFHLRLPPLLGLAPWSAEFFVSFNLGWLAIWALALHAFARGAAGLAPRAALCFLALAGVGNAIWHGLLSLAVAGYFPGAVSAFATGAAGILLLHALSPAAAAGGRAE